MDNFYSEIPDLYLPHSEPVITRRDGVVRVFQSWRTRAPPLHERFELRGNYSSGDGRAVD